VRHHLRVRAASAKNNSSDHIAKSRAGLHTVIQIIIHDGDEKVLLTRDEYEDLIDARDAAIARRDIAAGMPILDSCEMEAYLAAKTPLAFWRQRANLTQAALAKTAGISQAFLAQIETGARTGSVTILAKLARALGLRIEDLIDG
jgi:DNA-binding XRE family transcriptional regulator